MGRFGSRQYPVLFPARPRTAASLASLLDSLVLCSWTTRPFLSSLERTAGT
jgi:hypothetical protein